MWQHRAVGSRCHAERDLRVPGSLGRKHSSFGVLVQVGKALVQVGARSWVEVGSPCRVGFVAQPFVAGQGVAELGLTQVAEAGVATVVLGAVQGPLVQMARGLYRPSAVTLSKLNAAFVVKTPSSR